MSKRQAEAIKLKVENLVAAQISGHAVPTEVSRWLSIVPDKLNEKLAKVGLINKRESIKLGPFLDSYIKGCSDLKPRTIERLENTAKN